MSVRIEKTKAGNYLLTVRKREIVLGQDEFDELRAGIGKIKARKEIAGYVETYFGSMYDVDAIKADQGLMDKLEAQFGDIRSDCESMGAHADPEAIMSELEESFGNDLEAYIKPDHDEGEDDEDGD